MPVGASKGYENSIASFKRNTYGVLEFSGGKPNLQRAPDRYLRAREEDVNTLT